METKNQYKKRVEDGQDIFDLCLQEYGGLNALFLLLADNPQLNLVRQLTPGEQINLRVEVPANVPLNKNQMDYFRANNIRVNMQEKELLEDDVVLVTATGSPISTTTGLTILSVGSVLVNPDPTILVGVLTSSGQVLTTSNGAIISHQTTPSIGNQDGFSILTAGGNEIKTNPPVLTYFITALGDYIETAQGDLLIL